MASKLERFQRSEWIYGVSDCKHGVIMVTHCVAHGVEEHVNAAIKHYHCNSLNLSQSVGVSLESFGTSISLVERATLWLGS